MKPRSRSLAGAAMAVVALPVFVGLTACLPTFPVPVGNAEKSSIDPAISGVWLFAEDSTLFVFEPYDKRTWLLTATEIAPDTDACEHGDDDADIEESEIATAHAAYAETMANIAALGSDCFSAERQPGAFKVWRSRFRGEWFMTWENKGVFDLERGFAPDGWLVFHVDTSVPGELVLGWIDTNTDAWQGFDALEDEEVTQSAVEKVFRKHADEPGFYTDEDALVLVRVRPEDLPLLAGFLDDGMLD